MALVTEYQSSEEVPEALKEIYIEKDGVFKLDVEMPDVKGLKSALESERTAAANAKKAEKALLERFKDIDPDKVRDMMAKLDGDEEGKLIAEGKLDEVFNKRFEKRDAHWQSIVDAEKAKVDVIEESKKKYEDGMLEYNFSSAFNGVIANNPGTLEIAVELAKKKGFRLDNNAKAVMYDTDGNVVLGKDGTPFAPSEWINSEETKSKYPSIYPGNTGGGDSQTNGKFNNVAQIMALPAAERMAQGRKIRK